MSEFDRWEEKALKHEYSPSVHRGAKVAWRAALEWVHERMEYGGSPAFREMIEEELDE